MLYNTTGFSGPRDEIGERDMKALTMKYGGSGSGVSRLSPELEAAYKKEQNDSKQSKTKN
jgi:hypothetical protein